MNKFDQRLKLLFSDFSNIIDVYHDLIYNKSGTFNGRIISRTSNCGFLQSELYREIMNRTSFLNRVIRFSFTFRFVCLTNKISQLPICQHETCNKQITHVKRNNTAFGEFCTIKCAFSSTIVNERRKVTTFSNYGVEHPSQCQEIQDKIKQTNLKLYGVEYTGQCNDVRNKMKQTNLERYGVENASQCPAVRDKAKQTNIERYGVEYAAQCRVFRDKAKQTNLERYGVENPLQSKEIQDKTKQTNLERYGVENPFQSKEVQEKSYITYLENHIDSIWDNILSNTHCIPLFDKSEYVGSNYDTLYQWECTNCNLRYESYYYSGKVKACPICTKSRSLGEIELYNYIQSLIPDVEVIANDYNVIPPKEIDIYIPSLKLAFEYNGDYWHSLKEDGYHEDKTSRCLSLGITLFHIWESDWKNNTDDIKAMISKYVQ